MYVYILEDLEQGEVSGVFNDFFVAVDELFKIINKNKERLEKWGFHKYIIKNDENSITFNFKEFYFQITRYEVN